jgi:phenylacetate-CoA ligase
MNSVEKKMLDYIKTSYYLEEMIRRSYWSRAKLLKYQEKELRRVVKHAYDSVPFYHKLLSEAQIKPENVKFVSDLNKLPIVTKNEIAENINSVFSEKSGTRDFRTLLTSGSTGKPLRVFITRDEDNFRKAKHLRSNLSCGHNPWDRWVTITSPSHFSEVTKLQQILGLYAPKFVSVFDDTPRQMSKIAKIRPDILDGYSSSLFLLAKEIERSDLKTIKPKSVFGGAELIDNSSRSFIETIFDAPFYDQYATIEFERMAWQCPAKSCYHIDADALIIQFVDKNGNEVSEGESGEMVCTSLFNYAMPFIRYAIGDVGISTDEECPCGRKLPLMKIIEGRSDSLLFLPSGRTLSPRTFTIAINKFQLSKCIEQFRVIQKKIDYFEVQIKLQNENVKRASVERELVKHLRKMLHIEMEEITFDIRFVEEIPLDKNGKLQIVSSELKQPL